MNHEQVRMRRTNEEEQSIIFSCSVCKDRLRLTHIQSGVDIRKVARLNFYCSGSGKFISLQRKICRLEYFPDRV